MIIELFGLPASGKTSLAHSLSVRGFRIIKIRSRSELIFYNILFFFRNPIRFFRLLFWVLINIGDRRLFYLKMTNAFFNDNAKYEKAARHPKAVLDQGYFQNILSLFEKEFGRKKLLLAYAKIIPKPDLLLILDLPRPERERRAAKRGFFAREKFGKHYIENWKITLERNYLLFKESLPDLDVKHLILDTRKETPYLIQEIETIL